MPFKIIIKGEVFTEADLKKRGNSEDPIITLCYKWFNKMPIVVNTSGSTGEQKSINLSLTLIELSAAKTLTFFSLKENSKALLCISPNYIGGIMMILRSIIGKLNLIVVPPSSDPLKNVQESDIEFAAMVPLQLEASINNKRTLPKKIIIGGAPIHRVLAEKARLIEESEIYATYGMTETYSHIALKKINQPEYSDYFTLLPGINITKDKVRNTLEINGDITQNQLLTTNDICEIKEEGLFKIIGRIDNIINSGGLKINPEVIERKIADIMRGVNYLFVGLPDKKLGEKVVLIIEGKNNRIKKDINIKSFNNILDKYELPKQIVFMKKFEYTETQKINRRLTIEKLISSDQN